MEPGSLPIGSWFLSVLYPMGQPVSVPLSSPGLTWNGGPAKTWSPPSGGCRPVELTDPGREDWSGSPHYYPWGRRVLWELPLKAHSRGRLTLSRAACLFEGLDLRVSPPSPSPTGAGQGLELPMTCRWVHTCVVLSEWLVVISHPQVSYRGPWIIPVV